MANQIINNGDSGLLARTKINDNFTEVYGSLVNVNTNLSQLTGTNTIQLTGTDTLSLSSSSGNFLTILAATSSMAGLMSSQDKLNLKNTLTNVQVLSTNVLAISGKTTISANLLAGYVGNIIFV